MLQQIQRNSFTSQQHISKTAGPGDHLSSLDFLAIADKGFELLLRIERNKDFFGSFKSGDHHFFTRDKTSARTRVSHYYGLRRDIAAPKILAQKEADAGIESTFVQPVHARASLGARTSCPQCARNALNRSLIMKAPPAFDPRLKTAARYQRCVNAALQPCLRA